MRPVSKIVCLLQFLGDAAAEALIDLFAKFPPHVPWHHCFERHRKAACGRGPSASHLEEILVTSGYDNFTLPIAFNNGNACCNFIDKLLEIVGRFSHFVSSNRYLPQPLDELQKYS